MSGIEAAGEVVTGGMIARAVEPRAGEAQEPGDCCLNCGTGLVGDFCHRCGQQGHVHRSLGAFWHDIAHSVLHFEGKIWRTLPLLAWRPGELTRRYIAGERARFLSPMALFLFSVFMMFALFSLVGADAYADRSADRRAAAEREFRAEQAETQEELASLRAERTRLAAAGEETATVDSEIRTTENELRLEAQLHATETAREAEEAAREAKAVRAEAGKAGAAIEDEFVVLTGANSVNEWFNDAYKKAKENPSLLIYKLQTNAYKFSWALIPISVPFVWLLFLHRRRYRRYRAYDHTVFVTYSIAFMSLAAIVYTLLKTAGLNGTAALLPFLIPPLHMYRQLRGAYQLSRRSALWRTFLLINFAFVAGSLFFTLLLALGVLG